MLVRLASTCDELRDFEPALAALKDAIDIDPACTTAWNTIGVICSRIDRLDEARDAFERALTVDPSNVAILINLGSVTLKLGDLATAKSCLDLAIELAPTQPIAHANMALTLLAFGRIEEAEESLQLAVLHGFDGAEPILERIEKMRAIRRAIVDAAAGAGDASQEDSSADATLDVRLQEARELLSALELRRQIPAVADALAGESGPSLDIQIEALKRHIADLESQFPS